MFKKDDFLICKPQECQRNSSNKNFEIYARVIEADKNGNVALDRYIKCGAVTVRHGNRTLVPEFLFADPMYQPMNMQELRDFKQGLEVNPNLKNDEITKETYSLVCTKIKERAKQRDSKER